MRVLNISYRLKNPNNFFNSLIISLLNSLVYFFEKQLTGEAHWEYAGGFAIVYTLCEMLGFFLHERAWNKFGKRVK